MLVRAEIEAAFLAACRAELTALKPGNVHVHAAGHDMVADQFERAAEAAAPYVADATLEVGERIRRAVEASLAAAGCNTNLGILLLCVPLAEAAMRLSCWREAGSSDAEGRADRVRGPSARGPQEDRSLAPALPPRGEGGRRLRIALARVLDGLTVSDAAEVFRAIAAANPGGLGEASEADVSGPATITLRQAMALAADRDRIARAYVTDYDDVFTFALPVLAAARAAMPAPELAVTALHLRLLAAFPDSHILRKYGAAIADDICREARALLHLIQPGLAAGAVEKLLAFDRSLKERRLNPGTTADFVVASVFAEQLERRLGSAKNST